jgi:hypothetical protein
MAIFEVSDRAQLANALQTCVSGDVIRLAEVDWVALLGGKVLNIGRPRKFDPENPVRVVAARRNTIIPGWEWKGWGGITVSGFTVQGSTSSVIAINACTDFRIEDCRAIGINANRDAWDDGGTGVRVSGSARVTVTGCDMTDLYRGFAATESEGVRLDGNRIWEVREGVTLGALKDSIISRNEISDIWPRYHKGEHPDGIQGQNNGLPRGCENVELSDNRIINLGQRAMGGIFFTTQQSAPEFRHKRITARRNLVMVSAKWGICFGGVDDGLIEHNIVLATFHSGSGYAKGQDGGRTSGALTPCISMGESSTGIVRHNVAHWYDNSMQRPGVLFEGNSSGWPTDALAALAKLRARA